MSQKHRLSPGLSHEETVWGIVYVLFQTLVLSALLVWGNGALGSPLNSGELNFLYYLVNFLASIGIYRKFLGRNLRQAVEHPAYFLQAVILGFVAYQACVWAVNRVAGVLVPGFTNYNDSAIAAMAAGNPVLMFLGTVVLVPLAEECLFRGLVFRNLYGKSHWAAYAVSILAFAAIHIVGYVGMYTPAQLLTAAAQYLPAGLCLAWSYTKADSIFAPIVIHGGINFLALRALR